MSGYFSALARHTGLGVAAVATSASSELMPAGNAPAATPDAERPRVVTSPDVEEVTFISTADTSDAAIEHRPLVVAADTAPPARTAGQSAAELTEKEGEGQHRNAHPKAIDLAPEESREIEAVSFLGVPSEPRRVPGLNGEEGRAVDSGRTIGLETATPAEARGASQKSTFRDERIQIGESGRAHGAKPPALQDSSIVVENPPRRSPVHQREGAEQTNASGVERQSLVRNYLKEVTEWVAESPALGSPVLELERESDVVRGTTALEAAALPSREASQREPPVKTPRPSPGPSLDVQDLSLSIGTIRIVVEEPPAAAPNPQVAAPRNVGGDRPASEPTRLSRYYLERW